MIQTPDKPIWRYYAFALAATLVVTLIRWFLDPLTGNLAAYTLYFLAVATSVMLGGWRVGVFATVLGGALGFWLFVYQAGRFNPGSPQQYVQLGLYLLTCTTITWLGEWGRRQTLRLKRSAAMINDREDLLRENTILLRTISDSTKDTIFVKDRDCRMRFANPATFALIGKTAHEVIGKTDAEFLNDPDAARRVMENDRRVMESGETIETEETLPLPDGTERIWLSRKTPYRDANENIIGLFGISRDITERKRAEQKLQVQSVALQAAADAIVITDATGVIQWVNTAFEQLTGYGASEAIGQTPRLLKSNYHDAVFYANMWRTIRSGKNWRSELINRRKDGSLYYEQMSITPVLDKHGKLAHFIAIKQDITERKKTEECLNRINEELEQANAHLEQKVQQRTAKLQEAVGELQHFSYTVTHDMRAPLRAMKGFAQILLEEAKVNLTPSEEQMIDRIIASAERMDNLIMDALNYNKLVRQEFTLVPVDVEALLREMIETYPEFHPSLVDVEIDSPLLPVLANKAGLTQCFSNLINNAIKFAKQNHKPFIRVYSEERRDCVRLWFEDRGIGIKHEYLDQVFDMFKQVHRGYSGTGIGLALVRKAAERMDGSVGVESEPEVGSRFWLQFARVVAAPPKVELELLKA